MIEIQGDMLEGGGQVLRLSIAIAAVTGTSIKIINIRAKRSPPGLRAQHLNAVKAIGFLTNAEIEGLSIGSQQIIFTPRSGLSGSFKVDVGTAGSISLVLQALMPVMAFSPDEISLEITGGTNNPKAPIAEYLQSILLPSVAKMGYNGSIEVVKRGFYPRGQGLVRASSKPVRNLNPLVLEKFGHIDKIWGLAYSCKLPQHIIERMAKSAQRLLSREGYDAVISTESLSETDTKCSVDPGCGLILFASLTSGGLLGGDALGKVGRPAEKVGEEAASNLLQSLRRSAPVDKHLADQLMVYIGLAKGKSKIRLSELTMHTLTCIELCKILLGVDYKIEGRVGEPAEVVCNGAGIINRSIMTG